MKRLSLAILTALVLAVPAQAQNLPQQVWTLPSPVIPLGYCDLAVGATAGGFSGCTGGIQVAPAPRP
jgi:hypothetical protein